MTSIMGLPSTRIGSGVLPSSSRDYTGRRPCLRMNYGQSGSQKQAHGISRRQNVNRGEFWDAVEYAIVCCATLLVYPGGTPYIRRLNA